MALLIGTPGSMSRALHQQPTTGSTACLQLTVVPTGERPDKGLCTAKISSHQASGQITVAIASLAEKHSAALVSVVFFYAPHLYFSAVIRSSFENLREARSLFLLVGTTVSI